MKTKIVLIVIIAIILLQSCTRAFSPYEAANHLKGKKCRMIK